MEIQKTIDKSIVVRIQKLMAITTERGATEAEAAIASEHVQRMLAEHNITMATIEASGGDTGEGGKRTRENVGRRQVYKWQRNLMSAIAKLHFCLAIPKFRYRMHGPEIFDGYDLIGRVDNVTTTRVMFEYLLQTIERLAREDVGNDPSQFFTKYAHSFKEGCADRLVDRLEDKHRDIVEQQERQVREDQAKAKHPAATKSNLPAIMLKDVIQHEDDLNNDLRRGWEPGTTAAKRAKDEQAERDREAKQEKRLAEAKAMGLDDDAAYYYSIGYDKERAIRTANARNEPDEPEKPETEAQKRKREAREERQRQRNREWWERREAREASRLDRTAYYKGNQAGDNVSLDRQVDKEKRVKIGR